MQRISHSPTVIRLITAVRPVLSQLDTRLRRQYSKLCRDHGLQHRVIAICAGVAAVVFFINVIQLQSQKQQIAAHYIVYVATRDIAPGELVTPSLVRQLPVPALLVAASVIVKLPAIAYAQQKIGSGEMITTINVADSPMIISIVPAGWRTIAITPPTALPPMSAGDYVDVIANGVVLVANAVVISATGESTSLTNMAFTTQVVIAVPADFAPIVATAAALGDATLVVAL